MNVPTDLLEVAGPSACCVGDSGGLRHPDAKHSAGRTGGTRADTHEHSRCSSAHQVQGSRVRSATTDHNRQVEVGDKSIQIERVGGGGDVLGRHHGPLDYQQVEAGIDGGAYVLLDVLRGEAGGGHDSAVDHLADSFRDQPRLDRLLVDLLHPAGCLLPWQGGDLGENRSRVVVAGPEPFEIEHTEAPDPPDLYRGRRADRRVHRRSHHRQLKAECVDLPGNIDVRGVPRAPAGNDRNVVEAPAATPRFTHADFDFHGPPPLLPARRQRTSGRRRLSC